MTGPQIQSDPGRSLDVGTLVLVVIVGVVLVSGFVVLAALGRDTTGYILFLGGPAVSALVGTILNRRVSNIQAQVTSSASETKALVEDSVSDLDNHLSEQDGHIVKTSADASALRRALVQPLTGVPSPRSRATAQDDLSGSLSRHPAGRGSTDG